MKMKTELKRRLLSGMALMLVGGLTMPVSHAEGADTNLSWTRTRACKQSPKAPPPKLLQKTYRYSEGAPKNWPFITTTDINGDGWCDWIGKGAVGFFVRSDKPYDGDEPPLDDFIYLGTKEGWRKINKTGVSAANFVDPVFVYSTSNSKPYVVALGGSVTDVFTMEYVNVDRWDDHADMLRAVSPRENAHVINFILKTACSTKKDYSIDFSTIGVICYGATESCPEGRQSCQDKKPKGLPISRP